MTPNIPGIVYVLVILLIIVTTGAAVGLVRFAEKLAAFTRTLEAFRITHAGHGNDVRALAVAASELAQAQPPAAVLDSVELVAEPCAGGGCCRGPLPEAGATDLPLVAPTPSVSAAEAAAAVTRKEASRDRLRAATVTQSAEHH